MKPRRARSKTKPDRSTSASTADHDLPINSPTEPADRLSHHKTESIDDSLPDEWVFLNESAKWAAPQLLGQFLVRHTEAGPIGGIIVETEAYLFDDPASHSFVGHRQRNHAMFGPPGQAYVYLIYGIHYCVNVVCGHTGVGEAVLIRAIEPTIGIDLIAQRRERAPRKEWTNGPGKVCSALGIDRTLDGTPLLGDRKMPRPLTVSNDAIAELPIQQPALSLVANPQRAQLLEQFGGIAIGTRIGITKAADQLLRFWLNQHPDVSLPRPKDATLVATHPR